MKTVQAIDLGAVCAMFAMSVALFPAVSLAQPPADAYAKAIAGAQEALEQSRDDEARGLLAATSRTARGFEFDYIEARLARGAGPNGPAPDLVEFVANPDVEARYAVLHPLDRRFAFICRDGSIRVHDLMRPAEPASVHRHPNGETIWSGAFSGDGRWFVSGHQNGEILVWEVPAWKVVKTIGLPGKTPVRQVAISPDGKSIVAEGENELELWSLAGESPTKVAGVGPRYNFGEGLAISPKGDVVATGGMFDIIVHDLKTGKPLRSMQHASYTMGIQFSPDGARIASAPRGNVNRFFGMFDATTGRSQYNKGPFAQYVVGLAFTPDGKRVAATGCENVLRLFDAATGEVVLSLSRPRCCQEPGFTASGRLLGWSEPDGFHFIDLGQKANADPK
jgi:WD40 repeat protein